MSLRRPVILPHLDPARCSVEDTSTSPRHLECTSDAALHSDVERITSRYLLKHERQRLGDSALQVEAFGCRYQQAACFANCCASCVIQMIVPLS
jgi:hypothetical protein